MALAEKRHIYAFLSSGEVRLRDFLTLLSHPGCSIFFSDTADQDDGF